MRACRICGCTDDRACLGGCSWLEEDLCSTCARQELARIGPPHGHAGVPHPTLPGVLVVGCHACWLERLLGLEESCR